MKFPICVSIYLLLSLVCCSTFYVDINTVELPYSELSSYDGFSTKEDMDNADFSSADETLANECKMEDADADDGVEEFDFEDALIKAKTFVNNEYMRPRRSYASRRNVFLGTNLFGPWRRHCFTTNDVELMETRKFFEYIIPKNYPAKLLTDRKVCLLMKYFNRIHQMVRLIITPDICYNSMRSFFDVLGGYLRNRVLPVAQLSFYAGELRPCTVQRLSNLLHECRVALNTQGNGWRQPPKDLLERLRAYNVKPLPQFSYRTIEPDACALLDLRSIERDAANMQMLVSLPHLELEDEDGFIMNIVLPFKKRRIYNIRASNAAFILMRFYLVVARCYETTGMCMNTYNDRFKLWIVENLQYHLFDDVFYPGLGGVLRIYENLRRSKKEIAKKFKTAGITTAPHVATADSRAEEKTESSSRVKQLKLMAFNATKRLQEAQRKKAKERIFVENYNARSGVNHFTTMAESIAFVPYLCVVILTMLVLLFLITTCSLYRTRKPACRAPNSDGSGCGSDNCVPLTPMDPMDQTTNQTAQIKRGQCCGKKVITRQAYSGTNRQRHPHSHLRDKQYQRQYGGSQDEVIVLTSDSNSVQPTQGRRKKQRSSDREQRRARRHGGYDILPINYWDNLKVTKPCDCDIEAMAHFLGDT